MEEERIWTKGFTTITISNALFIIGAFMVLPTIPLYLAELGAAESLVGVVATAYYVSSILTRFLINGVLAKTSKKRVLIAGLLCSTTAMALYGVAGSPAVVATLRVVQGIGLGSSSTIAATFAVDYLPETRRGQGVGFYSMGIVGAMTIAPAIGLYVRSGFGFLAMFLTAACTNLTAAIIVLFFIKEPQVAKAEEQEQTPQARQEQEQEQTPQTRRERERRKGKAKALQLSNFFDRRLIIPSALVLLFGICRATDMNYIALYAEEKAIEHLPWFFTIQTATMFFIRLIVGRSVDRRGRNFVLIPGGFALIASFAALSFANTSVLMLMGAFLGGLGFGVVAPNLQVWTISVVEPERRNVASAAYLSIMDIGAATGAPLMGVVAEFFNFTVMFRVGAGVALLYTIGYIIFGREKRTLR